MNNLLVKLNENDLRVDAKQSLISIYEAMVGSEQVMESAAREHMLAFKEQMHDKVGAAEISINEPYLEYELANFRLQYLQTLEKLFDSIESNQDAQKLYLHKNSSISLLETNGETKSINYKEPLGPQVNSRIEIETVRVKRRLKQSLDGKRQQAFGINKYIWHSQHDNKVRLSHKANDGLIFEWSNPPETGHPGEDYNCRCRAEPVLDAAGKL